MSSSLPAAFKELEPFVNDWALATQIERETKRRASTKEGLMDFFNAVFPETSRILQECDKFPLGTLPPSHQPLFNLVLMVAEVAPHVENYGGSPDVPYAFEETRFIAVHATNPTWKNLPPSKG